MKFRFGSGISRICVPLIKPESSGLSVFTGMISPDTVTVSAMEPTSILASMRK